LIEQSGRSRGNNSQFSKVDDREVDGITTIPSKKIQVNSCVRHCGIHLVYSSQSGYIDLIWGPPGPQYNRNPLSFLQVAAGD